MKIQTSTGDHLSDLRNQAEKVLHQRQAESPELAELSTEELLRLLNEIQVLQVELEMQNDELRRTQIELADSRDRYYDMFDFAPMGYFVVDGNGLIRQVNLAGAALLDIERRALIKKRFSAYIEPQSQDAFYLHRRQTLDAGGKRSCELQLLRRDGTPIHVRMESITNHDDQAEADSLRIAVTDIGAQKQMEGELRKLSHALGERVKELNCFYNISLLVEQHGHDVAAILQGTVDLLPTAWQYPEKTCARITVHGQIFTTPNLRQTDFKLAANIAVKGERAGALEVFYLEEKPEMDEGPFLWEERELIDAIAARLGRIIERIQAEEQLQHQAKLHAALSDLYVPLTVPAATIDDMTHAVFNVAKGLTQSEHGKVSFRDPVGGDHVSNTPSKLTADDCSLRPENEVTIPIGMEGCQTGPWENGINTLEPFYTNAAPPHQTTGGDLQGYVPIRRILMVPVLLGKELVGQIVLANKATDYTDQDLDAVCKVAAFYALAIQRQRAHEALQQAHDELEQRVEQRTADLKDLSDKLLAVQESERKKIAGELHDNIGQCLAAIKFGVENAIHKNRCASKTDCESVLETLIPTIQHAIDDVRRLHTGLRPSVLDELGIVSAVAWHCREIEGLCAGVHIEQRIAITENEVPQELKIVIFRILQEALNNAVKHSRSTAVQVTLSRSQKTIELSVRDDGEGFDVAGLQACRPAPGLGLSSMQERVVRSGGVFSIDSKPGQGTTIRASWSGHK